MLRHSGATKTKDSLVSLTPRAAKLIKGKLVSSPNFQDSRGLGLVWE